MVNSISALRALIILNLHHLIGRKGRLLQTILFSDREIGPREFFQSSNAVILLEPGIQNNSDEELNPSNTKPNQISILNLIIHYYHDKSKNSFIPRMSLTHATSLLAL